jgi:hypothetical protein
VALELKDACERCGVALAADGDATICSYECTFCTACAASFDHVCPNCSGELVRRPRRSASS